MLIAGVVAPTFAITAGERWKSCSCEQWDEHRLLARAYQIMGLFQVPITLRTLIWSREESWTGQSNREGTSRGRGGQDADIK